MAKKGVSNNNSKLFSPKNFLIGFLLVIIALLSFNTFLSSRNQGFDESANIGELYSLTSDPGVKMASVDSVQFACTPGPQPEPPRASLCKNGVCPRCTSTCVYPCGVCVPGANTPDFCQTLNEGRFCLSKEGYGLCERGSCKSQLRYVCIGGNCGKPPF